MATGHVEDFEPRVIRRPDRLPASDTELPEGRMPFCLSLFLPPLMQVIEMGNLPRLMIKLEPLLPYILKSYSKLPLPLPKKAVLREIL